MNFQFQDDLDCLAHNIKHHLREENRFHRAISLQVQKLRKCKEKIDSSKAKNQKKDKLCSIRSRNNDKQNEKQTNQEKPVEQQSECDSLKSVKEKAKKMRLVVPLQKMSVMRYGIMSKGYPSKAKHVSQLPYRLQVF